MAEHHVRFAHADKHCSHVSKGHLTACPLLVTAGEELLTTNRFGRPVQRSDLNRKWHAVVELAGLPMGTGFHDLKHFYTTRLGACGQHDPKTVQAVSRHSEFSQTRETYAHSPLAVEGVTITTFSGAFT
ncbi:integrase [Streptacidiphilus sp. MAP12-16]|uniref:tyrosine-type recombinase/integrase n=1 Tax=Streptacidiphilus sp. MAP12-16 TaxID=3156300 RepID=UPI0035156411